jgi:hypothetical protein
MSTDTVNGDAAKADAKPEEKPEPKQVEDTAIEDRIVKIEATRDEKIEALDAKVKAQKAEFEAEQRKALVEFREKLLAETREQKAKIRADANAAIKRYRQILKDRALKKEEHEGELEAARELLRAAGELPKSEPKPAKEEE